MYPFTQLYGLHWYGRCCVTEQWYGRCWVTEQLYGRCCVTEQLYGRCCVTEQLYGQCCFTEQKHGRCCVTEQWYGLCCFTEQKHGHWRYAVNGRYHQRKCGFGVEWSLQAGLKKKLQGLGIKRELLGHVRKCKLSYFGHLCRYHGCQIAKTVVEEYVEERRRCIRPQKQCMDNIKMWTKWQYHIACGLSKTVAAGENSSAMVANAQTYSAEKKNG